jgi:hypothetical protein
LKRGNLQNLKIKAKKKKKKKKKLVYGTHNEKTDWWSMVGERGIESGRMSDVDTCLVSRL